jgi:nicotinate-nucleotide adenylyltransferase
MQPIGIFGGTFDPIHFGHLRTAFEMYQVLGLGELRFIPTGNPGHRDAPIADPGLRLAMVRAAVADQPGFVVDDREVRRQGVTYSVDTLSELFLACPAGIAGARSWISRTSSLRTGRAGRRPPADRWAS